jgi:transcriptional regulator with XRE-family HTH domain
MGRTAPFIALGALVLEKPHLSLEIVEQIVRETRAQRELSQLEIERLASMLNLTLSEYLNAEERYSEPTSSQLSEQINKLHQALKRLKLALPTPEQISLRYYLIHLGEAYAASQGQHPNLAPHHIGGEFEGEAVSAIDHYYSDVRLNEMISSVSQVLEWMNKTPASMKKISNWWDRKPHWLENDDELMMERLLTPPHDLPKNAHRRRSTEHLIGLQLPEVYERTFKEKFGVSQSPRVRVFALS